MVDFLKDNQVPATLDEALQDGNWEVILHRFAVSEFSAENLDFLRAVAEAVVRAHLTHDRLERLVFALRHLESMTLEETAEAVQASDLVLWVTHARNPARKADADFFAGLRQWFRERPHLRFPPVVVVLSHVDLLTPAMEWAPPYDWAGGTRTKERSMADAVTAAQETFPDVAGLVPVCAAAGKKKTLVARYSVRISSVPKRQK